MPPSKAKKRASSGPDNPTKRLKFPNAHPGSSTKGVKSPPSGHELFAKLPIELRIKIWASALTCETAVAPAQQRVGGNIFFVNELETPAAKETVNTLKAISRTCRSFANDQSAFPTFYEVNAFHFSQPTELIAYAASIAPNKLTAIKTIMISTQDWGHLGNSAFAHRIFGPFLDPLILYKGLERLELSFTGGDARVVYEPPEGREIHLVERNERSHCGMERLEVTLQKVITDMSRIRLIGIKGFVGYDDVDAKGSLVIRGAKFDQTVSAHGIYFKESHAYEAPQTAQEVFTAKDVSKFYADDDKIQVEAFLINWPSGVHQTLQGPRNITPERQATLEQRRQSFYEDVLVDVLGVDRLTLRDKYFRSMSFNRTWLPPNEFGQTLTRGDEPQNDYNQSELLWHPFSNLRLEAGRPYIYIFGEGMNPPSTLAERQRVAKEFSRRPKIRKHLDVVWTWFPKEVRFTYLNDMAEWCLRELIAWPRKRKPRKDPTLRPMNPRAIFGPHGFFTNVEEYKSLNGFQHLQGLVEDVLQRWDVMFGS